MLLTNIISFYLLSNFKTKIIQQITARLLQQTKKATPFGAAFHIISDSQDKKLGADKKGIKFLHGYRIIIQDYFLIYRLYKSNQNMPLIKNKVLS